MKKADILLGLVVLSLLAAAGGVLVDRLASAVGPETNTLHAELALSQPTITPADVKALGQLPDVRPPNVEPNSVAIVECEWGLPAYHRGDTVSSYMVARNVGSNVVESADVVVYAEQMVVVDEVPSIKWVHVAGTVYHYEGLNLTPLSDYRQNITFTIPSTYKNGSVVGTYRLNMTMYVNGDNTTSACKVTKEVNIL